MPTLTKRYYTIDQIENIYHSCLIDDQLRLLNKAFDIKESNPSLTKQVCIAKALGFEPSISGSEFFEKLTSVS